VVPLTAVVYASYGDSVFVVEPQVAAGSQASAGTEASEPRDGVSTAALVARQQFVRLGESRGDFVAIADGVQVGQELATSGAFKLRNGLPVVIKTETGPKPELDPHPVNR
jgi:membrane fusion protein, multidrug efflux system